MTVHETDCDHRWMTKDGDQMGLRRLLSDVTAGLGDQHTHKTLTQALADLGMPSVEEGSKRERVERSLAQTQDSRLPHVAEHFLQTQCTDAPTRNLLQDAMWATASPPEIPLRTRRELARAVDPEDLVQHCARFMALLDRFWHLDDDPLAGWSLSPSTKSLRARIEQHFLRNTDWTTEELFEQLGAFEAGGTRFARFAEASVAGDVLLDETVQRRMTATMNVHLRAAGLELRETGTVGGYPRFTLVSVQLAHARNAEERHLHHPLEAGHPVPVRSRQRHRGRQRRRSDLRPHRHRRRHPLARSAVLVAGQRAPRRRRRGQKEPLRAAPRQPSRQLSRPAQPLRQLPPHPRSRGVRHACAPPGGMASLGSQDRPRTRPPGPPSLPNGLSPPAAPRPARRPGSRRIAALHPRLRPHPRHHQVRGHGRRRQGPQAQRLRGLPLRTRRTPGRDRSPDAPGIFPSTPVPAPRRHRPPLRSRPDRPSRGGRR
ncbi:Basic proline-rich protein precursor [Streptomyces venezuelae]|nr:Basic proline-rich protein precursor [Streptomyces venezuelae]